MNVEEFVTNNYIRFYKAKYILKKMLEISMFMKVLFHKKLDFISPYIYYNMPIFGGKMLFLKY